jgi:hypothetical protein
MHPRHAHRSALRAATAALAMLLVVAAAAMLAQGGPKFFPDDPLGREPETQDASGAQEWEIGLAADLLLNLYTLPGDPATGVRAQNINTIDEVPDSSWFTNRIYARPVSLDEIARGPNTTGGPAPGRWTIIRPKSSGISPGFTMRDSAGEVWFISFDAASNPIAPTAAIMVATKLFWALGYNQVETHLASIRPEDIDIAENATIRQHGRRRPFTRADLHDVLRRAARRPDGSYRGVAGRAVPGRVLGGFRYHGTRPDDPNDIVPHEHRRELRALQVFGAWTNLVDMKAGNTLDTVVMENGRGIVKHYLQDVGSAFGTGAIEPRDGDEGHEHLYEGGHVWRRLVTLGFYIRPWQTIRYQDHPEIGRFEGDRFDPEQWRPRVPVAALRHARADDKFWAALRVMAFTDEHIRAAVAAGGYTDPAAEQLLASVLMKRRNTIGRVYFTAINPLLRFTLDDAGTLAFENPAVRAGFAAAPAGGYQATWFRFDNHSRETQPLGTTSAATGERLQAPAALPREAGAFVQVSVSAVQPAHAAWAQPVDVYFRRASSGWALVGLERLP